MNTYIQNLSAVVSGIWLRIIGFSDTPSLLVLALIVNLVTVLPAAFRIQKADPASQPGSAESVHDTSAGGSTA